jgi:hypothetical protein
MPAGEERAVNVDFWGAAKVWHGPFGVTFTFASSTTCGFSYYPAGNVRARVGPIVGLFGSQRQSAA